MLPFPSPRLEFRAMRVGVLLTLALTAVSTGCGQRVCIEWSAEEGVCPSRAEVQSQHIGACTNIASVDGEGTHEGDLCCYPVTKQGPLPPCAFPDVSSGNKSVGSGFSSGSGGSDPSGGCQSGGACGAILNFGCSACAATNLCASQLNLCEQTPTVCRASTARRAASTSPPSSPARRNARR